MSAQVVLAVAVLFGDDDAGTKVVAIAIALAGALVLAAGLWKLPQVRGRGNALIIVGAPRAGIPAEANRSRHRVCRIGRIAAPMATPQLPRPQPVPTPETKHFWEGTALGELRLQRCRACSSTYFPPQPFCPACSSDDIELVRSSGRGFLYSYVITYRAAPGFDAPYVIAVVELEEGPRLLTNIVEVDPDPDGLPLDLPLEAVYETVGEITLPLFRPRTA